MKTAKQINSILCDDIREEKGNKLSLMGMYGGDVIVNDFPSILPKLCLFVQLIQLQTLLSKEINVTVHAPQTSEIKMTLAPPNAKIGHNVILGIQITPFRFNAPGEALIELREANSKGPFLTHKFNIVKSEPQQSTIEKKK